MDSVHLEVDSCSPTVLSGTSLKDSGQERVSSGAELLVIRLVVHFCLEGDMAKRVVIFSFTSCVSWLGKMTKDLEGQRLDKWF